MLPILFHLISLSGTWQSGGKGGSAIGRLFVLVRRIQPALDTSGVGIFDRLIDGQCLLVELDGLLGLAQGGVGQAQEGGANEAGEENRRASGHAKHA
jgi:hypothetical protein